MQGCQSTFAWMNLSVQQRLALGKSSPAEVLWVNVSVGEICTVEMLLDQGLFPTECLGLEALKHLLSALP